LAGGACASIPLTHRRHPIAWRGATGNSDGKEWERDTDIAYMFQSGSLKGMEIRWRNATYRTNATSGDLDENRLIVNYSLAIW
jgi:hypothetical protein